MWLGHCFLHQLYVCSWWVLFFFSSFWLVLLFSMDVRRRRGLSVTANFRSWCLAPPPVCPFKPLLVECQFLMVFPQVGCGRVDSFSGVPGRVLCSSLSISHSLKRIALSILRLYPFVGCYRHLLVFLNLFSSSNEFFWCSKKSINVSSTFQPPFVKNTPCFLFSMWQVWMSWDSLFASVIGAVVGLWEVCVCWWISQRSCENQ